MNEWLKKLLEDINKGAEDKVLLGRYKELKGDVGFLDKMREVGAWVRGGEDFDNSIKKVLGDNFLNQYKAAEPKAKKEVYLSDLLKEQNEPMKMATADPNADDPVLDEMKKRAEKNKKYQSEQEAAQKLAAKQMMEEKQKAPFREKQVPGMFDQRGDVTASYKKQVVPQNVNRTFDDLDTKNIFDGYEEAAAHLQKRVNNGGMRLPVKQSGNMMVAQSNIDDVPLDELEKSLKPGNVTDKLAFDYYKDSRNISEALKTSRSFEEAAVKRELKSGTQLSSQARAMIQQGKYKDGIPETVRAALMEQFLYDPTVEKFAQKDANFADKLKQQRLNFYKNYPAYGETIVANKIAQAREDGGHNNALSNIVGQEETDELVDSMDLSPDEKEIYQKRIRPKLGALRTFGRTLGNWIPGVAAMVNDEPIPTTGLVENFANARDKVFYGVGKSLASANVLPLIKGSSIRDLYSTKEDQLASSVENDLLTRSVRPKGLVNAIGYHGGTVTGQVFGMGAVGKWLQGAKLVKSPEVASGIAGALTSYGNYKEEAMKVMPDQPQWKQDIYSLGMTGLEYVSEKFFPDVKVVDAVSDATRSSIAKTITNLTENKISAAAASQIIGSAFAKDIAKIGLKTVEGNTKETVEELSTTLGQAFLQSALTGRSVDTEKLGKDAYETFVTTMLGSTFVSGIAAHYDVNRGKMNRQALHDIATNPQRYINSIEKQAAIDDDLAVDKDERIRNVNLAAKVASEIKDFGLTDKQSGEYILHGMNQKLLEEKLENTTSDGARKKIQEQLTFSKKVQAGIIDGKSETDVIAEVNAEEAAKEKEETAVAAKVAPVTTPATPAAPVTFTARDAGQIDEAVKQSKGVAQKVYSDAGKILKSMKKIAPGLAVTVHHDQATYDKAVQEAGGTKADASGSGGFYVNQDSEQIHLNIPQMEERFEKRGGSLNEVFHEAAHPLLEMLAKKNPEVFNDFHAQLKSLETELPGVDKALKFGENYEADGDTQVKKEAVVEFIGMVGNGDINLKKVSPTVLQRVKGIIENIANTLGLDFKFSETVDAKDIQKVARQFSAALKKGRELQVKGVTKSKSKQQLSRARLDMSARPEPKKIGVPSSPGMNTQDNTKKREEYKAKQVEVNKVYTKDLESFYKKAMKPGQQFELGEPPGIAQSKEIGFSNAPIVMSQPTLELKEEKHEDDGLMQGDVTNLANNISNPMAILQDANFPNRKMFIAEHTDYKKPLAIVVQQGSNENQVITAFPKDIGAVLKEITSNKRLLYANKEKILPFLKRFKGTNSEDSAKAASTLINAFKNPRPLFSKSKPNEKTKEEVNPSTTIKSADNIQRTDKKTDTGSVTSSPKRTEVQTKISDLSKAGLLKGVDGVSNMSAAEIDANMQLMDAMAGVWKDISGKDNFYDEFVADVKAADTKRFEAMGGTLFQNDSTSESARKDSRATLGLFYVPQLEKMQGMKVSPQQIKDLIKSRGKQIERDLMNEVLSYDKYQNVKKIDFNEFKSDVEMQVMKLERITTKTYAGYGADNLGGDIFHNKRTIIFNAPVNHGEYGHFSGDFKADKSEMSRRVWKLRQIPGTNQWAAVDRDKPENTSAADIHNYVGTAGSKQEVIDWIKDRIMRKNRDVNVGLFGHVRMWDDDNDDEVGYLAELQSDFFQKNKASEAFESQTAAVPQAVDDDAHYSTEKPLATEIAARFEKEMDLKHMLNQQGDIYVFHKDSQEPIIVLKKEDFKKPYNPYEEDWQHHNVNQSIVNAAGDVAYKHKEYSDVYKEIKADYRVGLEEGKKAKIEAWSKTHPLEINNNIKQFIASQKIHEVRILREAIKLAAQEGKTKLRFPSDYTLARIEGYISDGDSDNMMPYEIIRGDYNGLEEGDRIDYGGEEFKIIEASSRTFRAAPTDQVTVIDRDQLITEEVDSRKSDIVYEAEKHFNDINAITREELDDWSPNEHMAEEAKDLLEELFDQIETARETEAAVEAGKEGDVEIEPVTVDWNDIDDRLESRISNYYNELDDTDLVSWCSEVSSDGRGNIYAVERRSSIITLDQPEEYSNEPESDEDDFEENLSRDQKTVVNKYRELHKEIQKLYPDSKWVRDSNSSQWLEIPLTEAHKNNPVIAFQEEGGKIKGAIDFLNDNRATVHIFDGADISTLAHEMAGHLGRRVLEKLAAQNKGFAKDYEVVKKWAGVQNDNWTTKSEEKFARGFETYLKRGIAPTKQLKSVFDKLAQWLSQIYNFIKGNEHLVNVELTPQVIEVFDRLLGGEREKPQFSKSKPASLKQLGVTKEDTATTFIDKLIAHDGEHTNLLKAIKADARFDSIKLEAYADIDDAGVYHSQGSKNAGLMQISERADAYRTGVHEMMHFLTLDSSVANEVKGTESYKALDEMYKYIASKKGKPGFLHTSDLNYGLANVKEFMAELLINEEFRNYVSDVTAANWDEIKQNNKSIQASQAGSIGDLLLNFFRDVMEKLVGKKESGIAIDASKPVVENAAQLAKELFFQEKPKPQFSKTVKGNIKAATDSRVKDKVTMNELAALKKQVKDKLKGMNAGFVEGVKETKADQQHLQDVKNAISDRVNEIMKDAEDRKVFTGTIKSRVLQSVTNKLNNAKTPYSLLKFADHMEKVLENVEYDKDLQAANKLKKQIKTAVKDKKNERSALTKDYIKDFLSINPDSTTDIKEYVETATKVLSVAQGVKVTANVEGARVKNDTMPINHDEIEAYTDIQLEEAEKQAAQRLAEMHEDLVAAGIIDPATMSLAEMQDMVKAIVGDSEANINKVEEKLAAHDNKMKALRSVAEYGRMGLQEYNNDNTILTDEEQNVINDILKIDINKLTGVQLAKMIDVMNNIVVNENFVGSGETSIISVVQQKTKELAAYLKSKKINLTEIKNQIIKSATSVNLFFEFITKHTGAAAEIQRLSGIADIFTGHARAKNLQQKATEGYKALKKTMGKDIDSALNKYRRGVYADVMNNFGGTKAEQLDEFVRRKQWIVATMQRLQQSSVKREQLEGKLLEQVYDELLDGVGSPVDVQAQMQQIEPNNIPLVDYWRQQFQSRKELTKENAELYNNKTFEDVENYTATSLKGVDNKLGVTANRERDLFEQTFISQGLRNDPAGTKFQKSRMPMPPRQSVLDLDFDRVQSRKFYETNYDVETSKAIAQAKQFLQSEDSIALLGGTENRKTVTEAVQKSVALQRGQSFTTDKLAKSVIKALSPLQGKAVRIALASIAQWPKQYVSIAFNTMINLWNDSPLFVKAMGVSRNIQLFDQFNIGQRGATQAGYNKEVDTGEIERALIGNDTEKALAAINRKAAELSEFLMSGLVKADVNVARRSWLAFYMQSLKKQGIDVDKVDWENEHQDPNMEAAAYAEQMVSRSQNPNDASSMANIYKQDKSGWLTLIRNVVLPFSTFSVNMRMRMTNDINKAFTASTAEGRREAGRSLLATAVEQVSFNALKVFIIGQLTTLGANAVAKFLGFESDDDDDEEEKEAKKKKEMAKKTKKWLANTVSDLFFSGMGSGTQSLMQDGVNKLHELVSAKVDENGDQVDIPDIFYSPDKSWMDYLGMYSIAPKKVVDVWKDGKLLTLGGEEVTKGGFNYETEMVDLTPEEQKTMVLLTIIDGMALFGLSDAEVSQINNKLRLIVKKKMTERLGEVREVEMGFKPK